MYDKRIKTVLAAAASLTILVAAGEIRYTGMLYLTSQQNNTISPIHVTQQLCVCYSKTVKSVTL